MSQKSITILKSLKECLTQNSLPAENFPVMDVAALIHAEHNAWLTDVAQDWGVYETAYAQKITEAACEKNTAELMKLIDDLVNHLTTITEKAASIKEGNLINKDEITDFFTIRSYKNYARKAYEKHPSHLKPKKLAFQGKGVVYTVVTGNYDILHDPQYIDKDFDYICFTDNRNLTSPIWSFRYVENPEGLDDARLSRKYKILCHDFLKEYDYSIYIDGKIQIIGNLKKYMEKYSCGSPMLCFPHFVRNCAYKEAEICVGLRKDSAQIIQAQMEGYALEGYPANNGLVDCACLVRQHHSNTLQEIMVSWWNEVKNKSRRDQLSIGYICWKHSFLYDLSDLYTYQNDYLRNSRNWEL